MRAIPGSIEDVAADLCYSRNYTPYSYCVLRDVQLAEHTSDIPSVCPSLMEWSTPVSGYVTVTINRHRLIVTCIGRRCADGSCEECCIVRAGDVPFLSLCCDGDARTLRSYVSSILCVWNVLGVE